MIRFCLCFPCFLCMGYFQIKKCIHAILSNVQKLSNFLSKRKLHHHQSIQSIVLTIPSLFFYIVYNTLLRSPHRLHHLNCMYSQVERSISQKFYDVLYNRKEESGSRQKKSIVHPRDLEISFANSSLEVNGPQFFQDLFKPENLVSNQAVTV